VPQHVIEQGECLSSVAAANGFDWKTLWEHPSNADLKKLRKDPNILYPGDVVFIPERNLRKVPCSTGMSHRFVVKGGIEKVRIRLLDELDRPRKQLAYALSVDGEERTGTTNDDGEVVESIRPHVEEVKLSFEVGGETREYTLRLGHLDPVTTVSGVQARLLNLGIDPGPCDGIAGPRTEQAIRTYQEAYGLDSTGKLDDETIASMTERHGR
jgi:N-acetylmuramoyl-L-alanine amidase